MDLQYWKFKLSFVVLRYGTGEVGYKQKKLTRLYSEMYITKKKTNEKNPQNPEIIQIRNQAFNCEVILSVMEEMLKIGFILTSSEGGQFMKFWATELQTSIPQPS